MLPHLIRCVALASLVAANSDRLDRRQDAELPVSADSASGAATSSTDNSPFVFPPGASFASADGSTSEAAAMVWPPGASFASATGTMSAPPGSPTPGSSVQASGPDTAAAAGATGGTTASFDTGPALSTPTASPVSAGSNAGAGGEAPADGVFTTTFLIDEDPFPLTRTIVQTITRPGQAAAAGGTGQVQDALETIQGNAKLGGQTGVATQIIAFSAGADGSVTTETIIPQPPIPSKTASAEDALFTPAGFDGFHRPQTREYTFDIEYTAGSPDGFHRRITTVNGLFPGPLIEANKGDTIVVHVNNHLDNGRTQSIHWHGMRHLNTPHMDGVPGITQCPIPAGGSYTYEFTLDSEMGTYWWHSHSGNTQADGVSGGFIVHAPDEPYQKGRDYDEERVIYLQDWMRDQSDDILDGISSDLLFRNGTTVGPPDSSLLNGIGQTVCEDADPTHQCDQTEPRTMTIPTGRTRFRVINMGSHAMYRVSLDRHVLKVIEVDDTPVQEVEVTEIPLHPGQRYSFIVDADQGVAGDKFFMRSRLATNCLGPKAREQEQKMIIQYAGDNGREPVDQPWDNLMDSSDRCQDLDQQVAENFIPIGVDPVPQDAFAIDVFKTKAGVIVNRRNESITGFTVNDVSYVNYVNKPILRDVLNGEDFNQSAVASVTFSGPSNSSVDILLLSDDDDPLSHPFHIHSRPFYIIQRGAGEMTPERFREQIVPNLRNPLRRDVITLSGKEWAVLRVPADTPGVWPMHCHIGWHLAVGKMGLVIMQPEQLRQTVQLPREWENLCAGLDPGVIDAGRRRRRSLPPQMRSLAAS